MKWVLIILAIIAGLIVLVTIIGMLIPKAHTATRTARLKQPIETVWAAITDHAAEPAWRGDIKAKERMPDRDGKPVWREVRGRGDSMVLQTLELDPPRKMVGRILDQSQFGGTWTYELAPADGGGCSITITEDGEIYNPIFRVVARLVIGYHGTMDGYLKALAGRFGEPLRLQE
jgi:uncharacterized protein YndB with AHSA1/START domain